MKQTEWLTVKKEVWEAVIWKQNLLIPTLNKKKKNG